MVGLYLISFSLVHISDQGRYKAKENATREQLFAANYSSRLPNNSSRRTIVHSIQNMLFGELQFALGELSSRRTSFAANHVRGEPRSRRTKFAANVTLVRGSRDFFPRTNFLANRSPVRGGVRANPGELGRTPPYSGERSAYSGERSAEFGGV